jgi:hypothetical protein
MCVVSYIPFKKGFILTSNRDENHQRLTVPPKKYIHNNDTLVYPKDLEKGGTWFALNSSEKKIACILNATGKNNTKEYNQSRGQLLLQTLLPEKLKLNTVELENTAPFVLLTLTFGSLPIFKEYSWDGEIISVKKKDLKQPKIWCSNTLYSPIENKKIRALFEKELSQLNSSNSILKFHKSLSQPLNSSVFLIKNAGIKTVSSTSFKFENKTKELFYNDFNEEKMTFLKNL